MSCCLPASLVQDGQKDPVGSTPTNVPRPFWQHLRVVGRIIAALVDNSPNHKPYPSPTCGEFNPCHSLLAEARMQALTALWNSVGHIPTSCEKTECRCKGHSVFEMQLPCEWRSKRDHISAIWGLVLCRPNKRGCGDGNSRVVDHQMSQYLCPPHLVVPLLIQQTRSSQVPS